MATKPRFLVVFGTRPEAIKMATLYKCLKEQDLFETKLCVTAQHREMLDHVLAFFDLTPDYDLDIMKQGQNLTQVTTRVLTEIEPVLEEFKPNMIFVHGDTTTTFATSLAAYYQKISVAHVEAGLRTNQKYSPWPEEMNRHLTGVLGDLHFAPTKSAQENLLKEGVESDKIVVTGNTVIDALLYTVNKLDGDKTLKDELHKQFDFLDSNKKLVLVTGHRRENFGDGFENICKSLWSLAEKYEDIEILYPVHLNPNVREPVFRILKNEGNPVSLRIHLIEPVEYEKFVYLMNRSYFILTDSGGIQEEAPSLGKPVLVMRDTTERQEAIDAGCVKLVGTSKDKILEESSKLIEDSEYYNQLSQAQNPFGDGTASVQIVDFLKETNV